MSGRWRMIWYRHWLELRGTLVLVWILCLLFIQTGSTRALRWDVWFALPAHPFGPELSSTPLGEALGLQIGVWASFAGRIPWFGFATSWILAGSGVQNLFYPGFPVIHTLTLPVISARWRSRSSSA